VIDDVQWSLCVVLVGGDYALNLVRCRTAAGCGGAAAPSPTFAIVDAETGGGVPSSAVAPTVLQWIR